jgi:hypothetical protein
MEDVLNIDFMCLANQVLDQRQQFYLLQIWIQIQVIACVHLPHWRLENVQSAIENDLPACVGDDVSRMSRA